MESDHWASANVDQKPEECSSSTEREARSIALEKAYVHDVYNQIASHLSHSRYRAWPKVKQFLLDLEPGSFVCDVGCGTGKYLSFNPFIFKIGVDRCSNLAGIARKRDHEVMVCDNLALPFRDECCDAVLSIAVIHHFATTERRVAALKELARVLRIGGKLMVSVWAMEQRHRRFESQDVLVPWNRPMTSSSDDKTSSIERDLNSTTTTTSEDDATHYHAYTQTSDSDSFPLSETFRKRAKAKHRGRSIDPTCPSSSQSSSDLSSPNESCYSFVRRALQKLAGTKRNRGGRRPWFLQGLDIPVEDENGEPGLMAPNEAEACASTCDNILERDLDQMMPIELRQLESDEFAHFLQSEFSESKAKFTSDKNSRRRRTLETTGDVKQRSLIKDSMAGHPKSKSLSDLFSMLPIGMLKNHRRSIEDVITSAKFTAKACSDTSVFGKDTDNRSNSTFSGLELLFSSVEGDVGMRNVAVQTDICKPDSIDVAEKSTKSEGSECDSDTSKGNENRRRPLLVKQKKSVSQSSLENESSHDSTQNPTTSQISQEGLCWQDIQKSVKDLPDLKVKEVRSGSSHAALGGTTFWKQASLNEELMFSDRVQEKEELKKNLQKQRSLNEELMYGHRETIVNTRWDQVKEAFFSPSNVKCLQMLKSGISSRFARTNTLAAPDSVHNNKSQTAPSHTLDTGHGSVTSTQEIYNSTYQCSSSTPNVSFTPNIKPKLGYSSHSTSSLRNGLVRMLQNWKQGDDQTGTSSFGTVPTSPFLNGRGSKETTARRPLFAPFFTRRSSVGSINIARANDHSPSSKLMSPPPFLKRRPSENELIAEEGTAISNGNKLIPGVRHLRKLSREEGSDSSKDSSFQSDTSVDSEDSFASVIFIPKNVSMENVSGENVGYLGSDTRTNSVDSSELSPKSPALKLSPPSCNAPKSPSPLAAELLHRRRSPEVSPTKLNLYSSINSPKIASRFIFDENVTKYSISEQNILTTYPVISPLPEQPPEIVTTCLEGIQVKCTKELKSSPNKVQNKLPRENESQGALPSDLTEPTDDEALISSTKKTEMVQTNVPKKKKVEKIEVLRKPANYAENKENLTRQLIRRSLPKSLAVELFNPETDDADTSDTSSSSPNSVSSVVSVDMSNNSGVNLTAHEQTKALVSGEGGGSSTEENSALNKCSSIAFSSIPEEGESIISQNTDINMKSFGEEGQSSSDVSPKSRRKLTLSRLGSTSEWLSGLPCELTGGRRLSSEVKRTPGEKILLGEVKKIQQKGYGVETKWPSSLIDESSPQNGNSEVVISTKADEEVNHCASEVARLTDEMEEKDSLFDSFENLKEKPSRNPSIDSSVRLSSTCSCSIRGGDSFDSWTSAKSSITNSSSNHYNNSSTHHKSSLPNIITQSTSNAFSTPVHNLKSQGSKDSSSGGWKPKNHKALNRERAYSSKSSSATGEDTEDSTALTCHRYYHVFQEGELDKLIEKYVQNLHIISSYYDHANWCVIAEKVQVWTI